MDPLEFDQLFATATAREMEAYEFYSAAAQRVRDAAVREVFGQLASEEMGHYELLERFRADPTRPLRMKAPAQDWKVAESEELPALSIDMKPRDAIALAMKKEQQAVEFYRALATTAADLATQEIFENLANMELGHKHRLEEIFIDIGYPEVF